jgi:hypothetical protein
MISMIPPDYLIVVCVGRNVVSPIKLWRLFADENSPILKKLPKLAPIDFATIKHPLKIGRRTYSSTLGAIVIYRLAGWVEEEELKQMCNTLSEELAKRFKDYNIITGEKWIEF